MRFHGINTFPGGGHEELSDYVRGELGAGLRDLFTGLERLSLEDNFSGFVWEGTIAATTTTQIRHTLRQTPSSRIILRHVGNGLVTDSTTAWTKDFVYLRNEGAAAVTLKVLFLR